MPLVVTPWDEIPLWKMDSTSGSGAVWIDLAPDLDSYCLAFDRYLFAVKIPGEDDLSDYERLKYNAALFERLLNEARIEVVEEHLRIQAEDFQKQDELIRLKQEFEQERRLLRSGSL